MRYFLSVLMVSLLAGSAGRLWGAPAHPAQGTSPISKSSADLFKSQCSMCHGQDGKGYPALKTPDFTSEKWQAAHSDKEIGEVITNGSKTNTVMRGFGDKVKPEQIKELVQYIRALNSKRK